MKRLRQVLLLTVFIPLCNTGQQLVITTAEEIEFTFGIDSVFYTLKWQKIATCPIIHKDQHTFFVLLKGDSSILQKKLPKSADVHHYVIERSNTGKITLFYRGILANVPDSAVVVKDKTGIRLSDVFRSKQNFNESAAVLISDATAPLPLNADSSDTLHTQNVVKDEMPFQSSADFSAGKPLPPNQSSIAPFEQIVKKVQSAEFEFEKMMLIKDYILKNQITTQDLKILARLLTYDLTRLQLLKESYEFTTDHLNFSQLVSVFDFELSKQTFLQFLSEHEK